MIEQFLRQHGDYYNDKKFKDLTTIKMGGEIKHFIMPNNEEDVKEIVNFLRQNKIDFKVIGNGSNLICGDASYDGVIISLKKLNTYEIKGQEVYAQAGVMVPALANYLAKQSLSGLEFASGIPGNIGGLIYMNAGAYKAEMADIIKSVRVLKGNEIVELDKSELKLSYRYSIFQEHPHWIILSAILEMKKGSSEEIFNLMSERLKRRIASQPLDKPSAGSCFRNPEDNFAWKLIDGIGYRGYRKNDIMVSPKHSNFIINEGNGSAKDYLDIVYEIIDKVEKEYGIKLILEVEKFNC